MVTIMIMIMRLNYDNDNDYKVGWLWEGQKDQHAVGLNKHFFLCSCYEMTTLNIKWEQCSLAATIPYLMKKTSIKNIGIEESSSLMISRLWRSKTRETVFFHINEICSFLRPFKEKIQCTHPIYSFYDLSKPTTIINYLNKSYTYEFAEEVVFIAVHLPYVLLFTAVIIVFTAITSGLPQLLPPKVAAKSCNYRGKQKIAVLPSKPYPEARRLKKGIR